MGTLKIKLIRDYYDCGNLYSRANIELKSGLTVLVGCNGSGKSSMIQQLADYCRSHSIAFCKFDNISNGGTSNFGLLLEGFGGLDGGIEDLCYMATSSEGEKTIHNLGLYANKIHKAAYEASKSKNKQLVLLYDAIDSGTSIDSICYIKEIFKTLIAGYEANGLDVYMIVSANSFEMANGEQCFDVQGSKYVTFNGYNKYKKFILNSRKKKEARIEKWLASEEERKAMKKEET